MVPQRRAEKHAIALPGKKRSELKKNVGQPSVLSIVYKTDSHVGPLQPLEMTHCIDEPPDV